ncbi:MAG TPA: serine/threonine-protein kinase [Candidatus Polarisedimenticolaceae bacterium]
MNASTTPMLDHRFLVLDAIGRGGQGRVFRAFDRERERVVALKILHDENAAPGPGHPLAEEFAAWARLRHRRIVRAFELRRAASGPLAPGVPYLVLEHVDAFPAHRALVPGRIRAEGLEALARGVLDALEHVHARGLVHRDLKPGNVLVGPSRPDRVKLTDFGLAARAGRAGEPGRISGSLPYVAPESILGGEVDGRADLYALGVLMHYLATGRLPFESREPRSIVRWHLCGAPADPRRVNPSVPDRLARFVARLTERDPLRRPDGASAALELLGSRAPRPRGPEALPRAALATLRLAMDAVRMGAWRVLALPRERAHAAGLAEEALVLAQLHGLDVLRLDDDGGRPARGALATFLVARLLARGGRAQGAPLREEVLRGFPLEFFGGFPVWDRLRASAGPLRDVDLAAVGRGVAAFLGGSAGEPPALVVAAGRGLADPTCRAVLDALARAAPERAPGSPGPGLLILRGPAPVQATVRSRTPTRNRCVVLAC